MIDTIHTFILPAAFSLLPPKMESDAAKVMLLAIAFQESGCRYRYQLVGGPARGFWQFEQAGGVLGVLTHKKSKDIAYDVLEKLRYTYTPPDKRHSGEDARMVHSAI